MKQIEPYKGVRDFYPEDQRVQSYIFSAMRRAVESYGFEEYNASILESTELYTAKTSEEIVSEQTYTFTDRGGRSVTLRPEMTPTVARMVAARKRDFGFPLRLYCIQNFFRYERPQRGRLREFWQLNADIFGVSGIEADIETISAAHRVMKELGAGDELFSIHINSRKLLEEHFSTKLHKKEDFLAMLRLLDKKEKVSHDAFKEEWEKLSKHPFEEITAPNETVAALLEGLKARGITNAVFDPFITRGFDYYTDLVFEVYDTDPVNPRSMFGGGRYDNLVGQYGNEDVPAVGFAMGDVVVHDFLETHRLLPPLPSRAHVYLAAVTESEREDALRFADRLRASGVNVALGMKHAKVGDHIKAAVKLGIPHFIAYGEKEKTSDMVSLKKLSTEEETEVPVDKLPGVLLS